MEKMMSVVKILDKEFIPYISAEEISARIAETAKTLNNNLANKEEVIFLGVLNGSFMFYADIARQITLKAQFSFMRVSSYHGTESTGTIKSIMGVGNEVKGKTVVIIEDIVDTGLTIDYICKTLEEAGAKEVIICTLLFKEPAFKGVNRPTYSCFTIENEFVVGYGLDYDEYGRNLPEIYKLKPN
jgi:hypoxanthine phosphoribosyltransferase